MLVQIILLGLPSHMETWKDAFAGRNEKQKGLERLLADLMEYDMRLNGQAEAATFPIRLNHCLQCTNTAQRVILHQMWRSTRNR